MFFSKSEVQAFFQQDRENGQRLGQRFHTYFKLDKIQNESDKIWCDRIYQADGSIARAMIEKSVDQTQ